MIFRTLPHGNRPIFWSSVTSTPNLPPVRCLSTAGGCSPLRSTTQPPPWEERTLPTLLLLSSRSRIGSSFRSSSCVSPLKFSRSQSFKVLKQTFVVSGRVEHLRLCVVEDSVLHTEMENLESEEEDTPKRVLYLKPMRWLGQIRPHHRDETWSGSLWQTFFASCVNENIPTLSELPLSACGYRKFQIIDTLGDHLCTCTTHSGV